MRARMAIVRTGFQVEHREVVLRDRPTHMMEISPKGTVPVMLLTDGTVIEESLEIMEYVQSWKLTPEEREWVNRNDNQFKFHLDRYKYPNRYEDVDHIEHREKASKFIQDLNEEIPNGNLSDAIFPFMYERITLQHAVRTLPFKMITLCLQITKTNLQTLHCVQRLDTQAAGHKSNEWRTLKAAVH